jgi:hypothetical protein
MTTVLNQPSSRTYYFPSATPSPSDIDSKQLYFDDINGPVDTSHIPISDFYQFMPNSIDPRQSSESQRFTLPDATAWTTIGGVDSNGSAGVATNATSPIGRGTLHQRDHSSSSVASTLSPTPLQRQPARLQAGNRPGRKPRKGEHRATSHLSTPTLTPKKTTFSQSSPQTPPSITSPSKRSRALDNGTKLLMPETLRRSRTGVDDSNFMSHQETPLFATQGQERLDLINGVGNFVNQSPQASQAGEIDSPYPEAWLEEYLRLDYKLDHMPTVMVPNQVRDPFKQHVYLPQNISQGSANPSYLMPTTVNTVLNAANMARSTSGSSTQSGPLSPFKTNSQLYPSHMASLHDDGRDVQDLKYEVSPNMESAPTTISPKDAMLEYHPAGNEAPLFNSPYSTAFTTVPSDPAKTATYRPEPTLAFSNLPSNMGPWTAAMQPPSALTTAPVQAYPTYTTSMMPTMAPMAMPSQGFMGAPQGMNHSRRTDAMPEFPAQLVSMESSASEAAPPSSAASSTMTPKPNTHADTGTFSCTYHGCSQRFQSPQKLQRHKRDAHRSSSGVTPGVGSGMSAAQLMERNSQTGPHRCDRINPTTGKPCSAIFSRPYDLTRHEDTIHNIRKQKVRCAICSEEKTFSRSDALTRHLRVVHPEVDFPGKHRKRGTRGD